MSLTTVRDSSPQFELSIPKTWQPDHVYRFTIPDDADESLPGALRVRNPRSGGFRSNLIVCRVPLREGQSFEQLFDAANDAKRAQDRSFEVLRSGAGTAQGRRLIWQDSASVAGPNRTQIFQREFGIEEADQGVTMCVFTSDKNNLDKLSRPLFGESLRQSESTSPTPSSPPTRGATPSARARVADPTPPMSAARASTRSSSTAAETPRRPVSGSRVASRPRS
ncbi:MAG: hypothetical protein H6729_00600 [Deltaproteobacteria bacterium]|nr:hypothetical protein [Deltaproteobacteria bacterium]